MRHPDRLQRALLRAAPPRRPVRTAFRNTSTRGRPSTDERRRDLGDRRSFSPARNSRSIGDRCGLGNPTHSMGSARPCQECHSAQAIGDRAQLYSTSALHASSGPLGRRLPLKSPGLIAGSCYRASPAKRLSGVSSTRRATTICAHGRRHIVVVAVLRSPISRRAQCRGVSHGPGAVAASGSAPPSIRSSRSPARLGSNLANASRSGAPCG
jgi:hypothetical protein